MKYNFFFFLKIHIFEFSSKEVKKSEGSRAQRRESKQYFTEAELQIGRFSRLPHIIFNIFARSTIIQCKYAESKISLTIKRPQAMFSYTVFNSRRRMHRHSTSIIVHPRISRVTRANRPLISIFSFLIDSPSG